jgi:hypothetical protein
MFGSKYMYLHMSEKQESGGAIYMIMETGLPGAHLFVHLFISHHLLNTNCT